MVWRTSTGDRVLNNTEAEFYLKVLQDSFMSTLVYNDWEYNLEEFELFASTGNSFFNRASFNQQIFLINFCLKALLKPDIPMPELDHLLEAAAFYPFAYLEQMVDDEISNQSYQKDHNIFEEDEYTYVYRKMTWDAFEKMILPDLLEIEEEFEEEFEEKPNPFYKQKCKSQNMKDWEFAIGCLADIIFWDRDWFFVSQQPQLLDGMDEARAYSLGITENYFTNRLPKVTDEDAVKALKEIMEWELDKMLDITFYSTNGESPATIEFSETFYERLIQSDFAEIGKGHTLTVKIDEEDIKIKAIDLDKGTITNRSRLIDYLKEEIVQESFQMLEKLGNSPSKDEYQKQTYALKIFQEMLYYLKNSKYRYLEY